MSTPSILRKLGDKVKKYSPFPDESDYQGLKEAQKTVDQVSPSAPKKEEEKPSSVEEPSAEDRLRTQYGTRPGEKRIDTTEMTRPLGSIPVYDQGGDVSTQNFENISSIPLGKGDPVKPVEQYEHPKSRVDYGAFKAKPETFDGGSVGGVKDEALSSPHYMPGGGPTEPAPAMPQIKVYDEGGDVDANDGKHQVAVLESGERVLTPEETMKYEHEHPGSQHKPEMSVPKAEVSGAPADFGGRVIPNPDNVQPVDSESITPRTDRLSGGAKMSTDLAHGTPDGNIENTTGNQVEMLGHEASANVPSSETLIQQDKEQAAKNGDLVGMGKAILADRHVVSPSRLGRIGSVEPIASDVNGTIPNPDLDASRNATATAVPTEMHQDIAGGPLISGAPTDYDKRTRRDFASMERKARLADYDHSIMEAMDKAAQTNDPAYQEQADRLKLAKMEYEKMNPWGSEGNHPGILGKIGHVAAKVGNIAGDVTVPRIMQNIPGTDLNKIQQRNALGSALTADTEASLRNQEEQNKLKIAELGKTAEIRTFNSLLKTLNPETGKPYTEDEALQHVKQTDEAKQAEGYISDQMKKPNPTTGKNFTREEATEAYYQMRSGARPPNEKEAVIKDFLKAKNLPDTPTNRDMARVEIEKRDTTAKAEAGLPAAEQKIRLQSSLAEDNANLNRIGANSLQRGEKADDYTLKENERHAMAVKQIDNAQNALESSDTNMLAASIVPALATMTETTAEGIKRLNPQELKRFMPASSGDALQWFETHYDKLTAGQIPTQYKTDLNELLKNLSKEEEAQNATNLKAIDQTLRQGATAPVENPKGAPKKVAPSKPAHKEAPPAGATHTGRSTVDHKLYYLDGQGHKLGEAPEPKK